MAKLLVTCCFKKRLWKNVLSIWPKITDAVMSPSTNDQHHAILTRSRPGFQPRHVANNDHAQPTPLGRKISLAQHDIR